MGAAESSLGAAPEMASPIERNKTEPTIVKNNRLTHAKIFPWPIETPRTTAPINSNRNVCKIMVITLFY